MKFLCFSILAVLFSIAIQFDAVEKCEHCLTVLKCVHGHFGGVVKSKRLLEHRLEATCRRYPHYRQSCLKLVKANFFKLFEDLQPEKYDPLKTCSDVQECIQTSETLVNSTISEIIS